MRRLALAGAAAVLVATGTGATAVPHAATTDLAQYVDPLIGTMGSGFVVPGAVVPFGMVQVSPDTEGQTSPFAYTGYQFHDQTIRGFSLLHEDGPGVHMGGDLPFMPVVGPVTSTDPTRYMVPFSHAAESAGAGAYAVQLGNGVRVDLAATTHAGLERFTFPPATAGSVIVAAGRSNSGVHPASLVVGRDTVEGSATDPDFGTGFTVYFSARFSRAFSSSETYRGAARSAARSVHGVDAGAVVGFASGAPVTVKVGLSFVDVAGARRNLAAEVPAWDVVRAQLQARSAWNAALARIRVGGGLARDLRTFYTALYHAQLHPNVFSDVDGRYIGHDRQVRRSKSIHYANFSLWDTVRGESALLATIQPNRYRDMVRSLYDEYLSSGELPRWSLWNTSPNYMNGDPAIQTIADGMCRGLLTGLDTEALYRAMRKLAFDRRSPDYLKYGYVPGDKASKGASDTLEYANADFALAMMADALGHPGDASLLRRRAGAWRREFDPATKFLRPRNADGSYPASWDPASDEGWKEGSGWQYLWLVPHDVAALTAAIGGRTATADRLDRFFSYAALSPTGGPAVPAVQNTVNVFGLQYRTTQYSPGNEHDLQAPYLYDWLGLPSHTQAVVAAERSLFNDTPYGLPGNDDLGSLSAWYVWSALGYYPVPQGAPVAAIGTPLFAHTELRTAGGVLTTDAPGVSAVNRFVAGARLDGRAYSRAWIGRNTLVKGGHLSFTMSATATSWAATPADAPPSLSTSGLRGFSCAR